MLYADIHTASNMVNCILKSWHLVEGKLQFEPSCDSLPRQLFVIQLLDLMDVVGEGVGNNRDHILAYTWVGRIVVVADFWEREAWGPEANIHGLFRGNRHSGSLTLRPML